MNYTFLSIDLGATSGRTVLGVYDGDTLQQRELTRFPNHIIQLGEHYFWDIFALYRHVIDALRQCATDNIPIHSIGIDTWGVDFVPFGADGLPLRNPYCYRDPYTTHGIMDDFFKQMPKDDVYHSTGIQFMNINSLFQFAQQRRANDSAFLAADKFLFIPDALTYMLTGEAVCEHTILSTSQMMDARTGCLDKDILRHLQLTEHHFGRLVQPGQVVGSLSPAVQQLTGLGALPVVAVAGHDTASAVAAVPSVDANFAYLSCGTWSLLGVEAPQPVINEQTFKFNFTNEGGVFGTTRLLRNICGLWIFERCRAEWSDAPDDVAILCDHAAKAQSCGSIINPDDERFANPSSMLQAINSYCSDHNMTQPQGYAQTTRLIFESLAHRYAEVVDMLRQISPVNISRLHVIGGGSQNAFLMQLTANALRLPVITGPVEATAMGNIMLQMVAAGLCHDLAQMHSLSVRSVSLKTYSPQV